MKTKQQRIELLMKFMRGEVPASALKDHVLTFLHLLTNNQRKMIEAKIGQVLPSNCSKYHPDEPLRGLWDGIPIGVTLMFHLSMVEYPHSLVEFIDCSNEGAFNTFLNSLPQKQLTDVIPKNNRIAD